MNYAEMDAAIREAEALIRRAETYKSKMARFITGRLRGIDADILKLLKRELQDFNAQTGTWKSK